MSGLTGGKRSASAHSRTLEDFKYILLKIKISIYKAIPEAKAKCYCVCTRENVLSAFVCVWMWGVS